jgi:23S rRNA pseudouridine1911/1915/1917 synthase
MERREVSTLFQVHIETGRPHQIRIHLAWAGHPLVGDPLYGPGGLPLQGLVGVPGDGGYCLHSERLEFQHPLTGASMELCAPPPPELRRKGEAGQLRS